LRITRKGKNIFAGDGANYNTLASHFHAKHAWDVFLRSRCTTKVPLRTRDLHKFDKLKTSDKRAVEGMLKRFIGKWEKKCNK